jgi:hypothetical protein
MPAFLHAQPRERGHQHLDVRIIRRLFVQHQAGCSRGCGTDDALGNLNADSQPLQSLRVGHADRLLVGRQMVDG